MIQNARGYPHIHGNPNDPCDSRCLETVLREGPVTDEEARKLARGMGKDWLCHHGEPCRCWQAYESQESKSNDLNPWPVIR